MKLPKAYKKGRAEFYGRWFLVDQNVLIPRPETEMIVDATLKLAGKAILPGVRPEEQKLRNRPRILDVGTGSGIIAITLALELPEAKVYASDISLPALGVAKKNAQRLGAKVNFFQRDLLGEGAKEQEIARKSSNEKSVFCCAEKIPEKFDVIVANLPYVDKGWRWLDKKALAVEPDLALYAEKGGLEIIFRLINEIFEKGALRAEGYLILEADPSQHESIVAFAEAKKMKLVEVRGFAVVFRWVEA